MLLFKGFDAPIGNGITTTMSVSNVSLHVPFSVEYVEHDYLMHKVLIRNIKREKIIAIGYSIPRTPSDKPKQIPVDLWDCNVNWENSELSGNGLHFLSVRLLCLKNPPNTKNSEVKSSALKGRPSVKRDIIHAYPFCLLKNMRRARFSLIGQIQLTYNLL